MKMTMHIDEELLHRVMSIYGCESKTSAIDLALREMERRHLLKAYSRSGLGLNARELKEGVNADYDVLADRAASTPASHGQRRTR
jgi:Arc/MetJ family transcription regulator